MQLGDSEFPHVPDIEAAYRAAHAALQPIAGCSHPPGEAESSHITDLLSHLPAVFHDVEQAVAARVGPRIAWQAPQRDGWDLLTICVDLDYSEHDFGGRLADDEYGPWHRDDNALHLASKAYRRECGWDFAPGPAGVWLLRLAPVSWAGGETGDWSYSGYLTAFVILHDRDEDGRYESVAHMWTAQAWRRRGIALELLREAETQFNFDRFEGPYTDAGRSVVDAVGTR